MNNTQTEPKIVGPAKVGEPGNFIFVANGQIIGVLQADCCVCAWKDGSTRWPGATMGFLWAYNDAADFGSMGCVRQLNRMKREYRG